MRKYNFQDLISSKETDVEYYRCDEVDTEIEMLLDAIILVIDQGGVLLEGQVIDELLPLIKDGKS